MDKESQKKMIELKYFYEEKIANMQVGFRTLQRDSVLLMRAKIRDFVNATNHHVLKLCKQETIHILNEAAEVRDLVKSKDFQIRKCVEMLKKQERELVNMYTMLANNKLKADVHDPESLVQRYEDVGSKESLDKTWMSLERIMYKHVDLKNMVKTYNSKFDLDPDSMLYGPFKFFGDYLRLTKDEKY